MEITPRIPAGRKIVETYSADGFRISGEAVNGPVLVFPERHVAWPACDVASITPGTLATVLDADPAVEVLLIGCGGRMQLLPRTLRDHFRAAGIGLEAMDTGAACRTYNVLLSEGRRVAAALLPLAS